MQLEIPIRVAVQITSSGSADSSLSRGAQHAIAQETGGFFELIWLPPRVAYRSDVAGALVDSAIYLFVAGLAFGSLVKPFVESIMKEAGKDFWDQVKKLVLRLRKSQVEETYRVSGNVYVAVELGEEFVLFELDTGVVAGNVSEFRALEELLSRQLETLAADWEEIAKTIQNFGLGKHREYIGALSFGDREQDNRVHVVSLRQGHFRVDPEPASRYFGSGKGGREWQ